MVLIQDEFDTANDNEALLYFFQELIYIQRAGCVV